MIKVLVREEEVQEEEGALLGYFMPETLPQLVQSFRDYETYFKDEKVNTGGVNAIGQYIHTQKGVWFEIVLCID